MADRITTNEQAGRRGTIPDSEAVETAVPEINLADPELLRDPFTAYGRLRERSSVARTQIPGIGHVWVVMRYDTAKAMLSDPRFEIRSDSFLRPDVPEHCRPYLRTMAEMNGAEHARLRKLVAPAFTPRRAAAFRPRIERLVTALLDDLPRYVTGGTVDLLEHFARPLPIDVICELVGIPEADRPRWREYGAHVATGYGKGFADSVPRIIEGAKAAVASRREDPCDDLLSDLIRIHDEHGDRLSDTELVTLVWHLVLAGQTPANLIANAVEFLLSRPELLAAIRSEPDLLPRAVEELMRWCGPQPLTIPRYAREDVDLEGVRIGRGEPVIAALVAANRDPRAFDDPESFDLHRGADGARRANAHIGFGHGPHFCLGASVARIQTEVALHGLLRRYRHLALAVSPAEIQRVPDPGTWRLASLPVTL